MKPQKLLCYLFPVAAGLGTAWLRYTAIDRAVDPGTGIPSSTGWLTAAYGVIAGVLVLLLLYTFLMGKRQGPSPPCWAARFIECCMWWQACFFWLRPPLPFSLWPIPMLLR